MSRIIRQDTNGIKPLLDTGELGYDNYPAGGDIGRMYVGTGTENIALAKKNEDTTGNAATATKLATARTINGVAFDGTANITLPVSDSTAVKLTGNQTIDGIKTFTSSPIVPTPTTYTQVANKVYVDGKYSGFKNYIINGNFDIWQYGTSQTTYGYGSADRWYSGNIGSTKTHSQVSCTDTERALFNAAYFSRTVVSSIAGAGNYVTTAQRIEDVTKLAGKTITVSFWAKANSNKNIWLEFRQLFGTGGSPSVLVNGIYGQAVGLTTTWQKKTITLTLPSIVGKTLGTAGVHTSCTELQFWFDVGSDITGRLPTGIQQSGTFDIAQVQLEEGSVATPFEQRPIGLELSLCQRYYETGLVDEFFNISNVSTNIGTGTKYKNTKRVVPTITLTYGTLQQNRIDGFSMYGHVGVGAWLDNVTFTASAEL